VIAWTISCCYKPRPPGTELNRRVPGLRALCSFFDHGRVSYSVEKGADDPNPRLGFAGRARQQGHDPVPNEVLPPRAAPYESY